MTATALLFSRVMRFNKNNRRSFPWRQSHDPYQVLVSEYMLQQTQTSRVIEPFLNFLTHFPNVQNLADAKRGDVLACWSGLGYNRRAIALHETAKHIVSDYDGIIPSDEVVLKSFPGIGSYTAAAIVIFAYNKRAIAIETNIRTVVVHHCLPDEDCVSDIAIARVMESVLCEAERQSVSYRDLYAALMDYGAHLKQVGVRVHCKAYTPQSRFEGSVRQARGAIIKTLVCSTQSVTEKHCASCTKQVWEKALKGLVRDGMIEKRGNQYVLCSGDSSAT